MTTAAPLEATPVAAVDFYREQESAEARASNPAIIAEHVRECVRCDLDGVPALAVTPKRSDPAHRESRVLYFFGGAFVVGSPEVDMPIIARLAAKTGITVVAPYYRRAPEHPHPAAVDDGFAAYRALLRVTPPARVAVVGESAGGNLSLAVTLKAREQCVALPAVLAVLSPWCDLTPTGESQQQPAGFDPTLDYALHLEEAAASYAGGMAQKDPRVSPLYADYAADFPPTLITTGTRELFLSDCERLAVRLRDAGVEASLRIWEDMWHVFEWYADIPESDQSLAEIAAFISERMSS